MKIQLKVLNKKFYQIDKMGGSYYDLPRYQTAGSAAVDLLCTEDVLISPGECKMIPTGLAIWIGSELSTNDTSLTIDKEKFTISEGYTYYPERLGVAGVIIPRSGLGHSKGLVLGNLVGLIDDDYQGELKVSAWNRLGSDLNDVPCECHSVHLKAGDRFAQLLFVPVIKAAWSIVDEFTNETERAGSGFGSTGK